MTKEKEIAKEFNLGKKKNCLVVNGH